MKFLPRVLLIAGVAFVALAAGILTAHLLRAPSTPETAATENLFKLTLPDSTGKPQAFKQWKGKVLVVNFWATWCPPCREEIPLFVETQKKYGANRVQFVGLAVDLTEEVQNYVKETPVNYPLLVDEEVGLNLMKAFGNRSGLPFTLVFDRAGNLVSRKIGAYKQKDLEEVLTPLLIP